MKPQKVNKKYDEDTCKNKHVFNGSLFYCLR